MILYTFVLVTVYGSYPFAFSTREAAEKYRQEKQAECEAYSEEEIGSDAEPYVTEITPIKLDDPAWREELPPKEPRAMKESDW